VRNGDFIFDAGHEVVGRVVVGDRRNDRRATAAAETFGMYINSRTRFVDRFIA